jgi:hypothetical protein
MKLRDALLQLQVTNNRGPFAYRYRLVDHDQTSKNYFCGNSGESVQVQPRLGKLLLNDSTGVVHELSLDTEVAIGKYRDEAGVSFVNADGHDVFLSFDGARTLQQTSERLMSDFSETYKRLN